MEIFKWVNLSNCIERRGGGVIITFGKDAKERVSFEDIQRHPSRLFDSPLFVTFLFERQVKRVSFSTIQLCLMSVYRKKKNLRFDVCVRRMRKLYSSWATRTISTTPSLLFLVSDSSPTLVTLASSVRDSRNIFHTDTHTHTQMKLRWHIELTRYFYSLVIAYNVSFSNCWRMDRALHLECPSTLLTSR